MPPILPSGGINIPAHSLGVGLLNVRVCHEVGNKTTVTATVFVFAKIGEISAQSWINFLKN